MLGLTAIQARYTGFSPKNSEEFSSASRSVKPGLIASGIVSAWTWAATLVSNSVRRLFMYNTYLFDYFYSFSPQRWPISMVFQDHGGMALAQLSKFSCLRKFVRSHPFTGVVLTALPTIAGRKAQTQRAVRTHLA
jgi:hypothetical protein